MSTGLMIFLGLVFACVFLLAQGLIVPVFGESAKTRRLLQQRLRKIEAENEQGELTSLIRDKYLKKLSPTERWLESLPVMERLAQLIEQSGNSILAHRLVALAVFLALVGGAVGWSVSRLLAAALGVAAAAFAVPFLKITRDRKKRFEKLDEQLPDAIDVMKRAIRAGHPFNSALRLVAEDMSEPIAREFQLTFADINYGNDVRRALLGLLLRVPSVSMMAVVTAVLVQKETGGNLAEIFERISSVIRGRFRFSRKVRTLSAEGRLSAWILALVPLGLFAVIWVTTPSYLPVLLDHPLGQKLLIFGGVMTVIGIFWMRKIIRIEV
ncbi:MAG TPA: type II secretion system F family protein [Steroidobacteraceae bacterium]|nr:type II secretion system F family protein [Steroidobacteraceae bacterium]